MEKLLAPKKRKVFLNYLDSLKVKPKEKCNLKKDFHTDYDHKMITKEEAEGLLSEGIKNLAEVQDKLYAHNQYSILIVLQAMDAAGKDGAIKHVMSGLNPSGVKVASFKTPSSTELDHDYFWRHYKELPARGEIGIFNRSHYENVLVTRVHPEYVLNENIPGIDSVEKMDKAFWKSRFKQINRFEKNLQENGTIVLKFFLHVGKDEQKKRFMERLDDPAKNWKFSTADVKERGYWNEYMDAYEELLEETSKDEAPWYVLPADDKWWTRLCLAAIVYNEVEKLGLSYPTVTDVEKQKLEAAKAQLNAE